MGTYVHGGIVERQPPRDADWERWIHIPQVHLWQAVLLSLNVEPAEAIYAWTLDTPTLERAQHRKFLKDFELRLDVATKNMEPCGPLKWEQEGHNWVMEYENPRLKHVVLHQFCLWASGTGWTLPAELRRVRAPMPVAGARWPWGSHETRLLRLLSAAAHEHWLAYDPAKPETAPKSDAVQGWLQAKGVTPANAEVMARLLRPESLPPGPRKKRVTQKKH